MSRTKSYYTADEKLVVVQVTRDSLWYQYDQQTGEILFTHRTEPWGAYEEYWYDALGRRVLKRTRQEEPLCTYFQGPVFTPGRCFSATERYVWDGDQLLWELRALGTDEQYPGGDAQAGVIGYTHAGGIDQPVGMVRNGETIVLHRGWRGLYVKATDTDGQPVGTSPQVPWPGVSWEVQGGFIDPRITHEWVGSLPMGHQDETGLTYQRNRYYDPESGRFTQPDPIGTELARWTRPNGLDIARIRVPLGVIGIIFESRPNVTADAASLCFKSGNATRDTIPSHLVVGAEVPPDVADFYVHMCPAGVYERGDGGLRVVIRPSGTEPKLKCYLQVVEQAGENTLDQAKQRATERLAALEAKVGR